jgi:hypothetical protein
MPCTNPILAYRKTNGAINFMRKSDYDAPHANKMLMPCGKCIICLRNKAKSWMLRMANEAKMHEQNCFITLTFEDEHLPKHGSLRLEDPQKFLKRLRKYLEKDWHMVDGVKTSKIPCKIKYFYCGEYGDQHQRPHYHLCIFGWAPHDMQIFSQKKSGDQFTSQTIAKIWTQGFHTVSDFTDATGAYTAYYMVKENIFFDLTPYDAIDPDTGEEIKRMPPFQRMSRRPGLGTTFYHKYKEEIINNGSYINGQSVPVPQAYLNILRKEDEEKYKVLKTNRENKSIQLAKQNPHLNTLYGLDAVDFIAKQKSKLKTRDVK